jgi:hypothetical protein
VKIGGGIDFVGREPGWGAAQRDAYNAARYHQPSDEVDERWDLEGAVDDLRLVAAAILRVADAARAPAWRAGDEFETARRRALDEAAGKPR